MGSFVRLAFSLISVAVLCCIRVHAQAALLMEEPYGFFGAVNPTGHNAIYFERICAETPVQVRRCHEGETGAVIARYQGIDGYDWLAIPLIPYLYSVEDVSKVPDHVDRETVNRLRDRYREAHLLSLGAHLSPGNLVHGGWTQLIGAAYERRIYVFRFATTEEQDDALIARLNADPNHSEFDLLFSNCADFARQTLNSYFPHTFRRSIFPDAGMTTPKQIAYKLVRYARKHPETQLTIFEIPQIPGYRRMSHANKNIDESFITTAYAIPITILNPWLAGGLFVDYLVRGRVVRLVPKYPTVLLPDTLGALTRIGPSEQNPAIAGTQAAGAVPAAVSATPVVAGAQSGLTEITAAQ
ncbi:MAG TPA: hypothetical protein VL991_07230 [Terracidiphilus sp.]|nr:hypothetical protein [Terracidiphilus sp.]